MITEIRGQTGVVLDEMRTGKIQDGGKTTDVMNLVGTTPGEKKEGVKV